MAGNLLPIVAIGAAAFLLGKKKKKTSGAGQEPEFEPGSGYGGEGEFLLTAIPSKAIEQDLTLAAKKIPAKKTQDDLVKEVKKEVEKEPKKKAPPGCKLGSVSKNKKYVCWGLRGKTGKFEIKGRRVPKYKTARNAAAAVAMSGGVNVSPLMWDDSVAFAVWCWLNRNKKDIYHCTSRYSVGRERCKPGKWKRY